MCTRTVHQELSNLQQRLPVEKPFHRLQRLSLLEVAQTEYAALLQEGSQPCQPYNPHKHLALTTTKEELMLNLDNYQERMGCYRTKKGLLF